MGLSRQAGFPTIVAICSRHTPCAVRSVRPEHGRTAHGVCLLHCPTFGKGRFMERTLVLLKPDCVQRRLMGRVIARLEDKGLDIVAMKLMRVTPELAKRHYAEHVKKAWYPELEAFITGGPVVAMIVEGPEAIRVVRRWSARPTDWRPTPARSAATSVPASR